jgi:iron-sulfur cluster assembly accessory protein
MQLFLSLQAALLGFVAAALLLEPTPTSVDAFSTNAILTRRTKSRMHSRMIGPTPPSFVTTSLQSSAEDTSVATATDDNNDNEDDPIEYEIPEDAVINIKPKAMKRLRELRAKQKDQDAFMVLRMGVRNGGCSGLSYIMDFADEDDVQEDDEIDEYTAEKLKCVVDAKSMLYLYGLELDYSEELIGGGFKFFNPNAEESCGCGSSFGV